MCTLVACELAASGKQQHSKHLVLLPFKVAGRLLQVNEVSILMNLWQKGVAIQTASSSKARMADTCDQGDLSMYSEAQ